MPVPVMSNQGKVWGPSWACLVSLLLTILTLAIPHGLAAQDTTSFPQLDAGRRVYDLTGSSLTTEQVDDIEAQIRQLAAVGANVVVVVRALDATPDQTLDQVEALQKAWAKETGASQVNTVAVLINRDPHDPNSARAGIYVGKTFNEGNVPSLEQVGIVENTLIPPLRIGDVHGSVMATLGRLEDSIVNGPPHRGAAGLCPPGHVSFVACEAKGADFELALSSAVTMRVN